MSILNANVRKIMHLSLNFNSIDKKIINIEFDIGLDMQMLIILFGISSYSHEYNLRQEKQGGGVSLFVAKLYQKKIYKALKKTQLHSNRVMQIKYKYK